MGTRSLTFVYEKYGDKQMPIINMYRQFDGYPSGHGAELAEFLDGFRIVNGYSGDPVKTANGMSCLSAQLVANFKKESGGFYLYPVTAKDCGQDYEYHILNIDGEFKIEVYYCGCNMFGIGGDYESEVVFSGSLPEFVDFCNVAETV